MKYCQSCGNTLPEGTKFCDKCGARQFDEANAESENRSNQYCTNCGYKLSDSDVFCPKCGTKVGLVPAKPVSFLQNKKNITALISAATIAIIGIIILIFALGHSSSNTPENVATTDSTEISAEGEYGFANRPWGMVLSGLIGSAEDADLAIWDGEGGFSYERTHNNHDVDDRSRRNIENLTFDTSNGQLKFDAYNTSSNTLASSFTGKITVSADKKVSYDGTFTNVKGVTMEFHLKGVLWDKEPEGDWKDCWWY